MNFTKLIVVLTACIPFFALSATAQTSPGKLLLQKGQKIQIDNNIKSVSTQEMMGQAVEITVDANMVHKVEVKDKKANSYLVSSTLTKFTTNGSAMGQELKFDSDKKEDLESEGGKAMKDLLNVSKEVELAENARVITGIKKDVTASSSGPIMDMVNNITGAEEDESNGANAAFDVIPAGKNVGDTWSDSSITEAIKTYRNYSFKELNGNNATILLTGMQITKKKSEVQGMEINISSEGKLSGEGIVDMNTGLVKQKTTILDATSVTEVMGQSIPGTTRVTTITTVKTI